MDYQLAIRDSLDASYAELTASFKRSLLAQNRSPRTIVVYLEALYFFGAFLKDKGMPQPITAITREHVESLVVAHMRMLAPSRL
jgi:hypothetical protein